MNAYLITSTFFKSWEDTNINRYWRRSYWISFKNMLASI